MTMPIRYCRSVDEARIAFARSGCGPEMVEVATWLTHLDHDWKSPVWGPRLTELTQHFTLTRYDSRGCGLSDREVKDLSFEAAVKDLEAVVDAAGLRQFVLLGCCSGSGVAIAYAARHPERVSHLILYGAFARGRLNRDASAEDIDETNTMLKLLQLGWGRDNPEFRQVYTTVFIPDSKPEQFRWFTELQRLSTSPETAIQLIYEFNIMDVTEQLPKIRCPTLVLHSRDDKRVPFTEGQLVARAIRDAEFVPLESRNHILLVQQPAWRQFFDETTRFVCNRAASADIKVDLMALTGREREVLDLIARGLDNAQIADQLSLSTKTVRNHINSIFGKLGTPTRARAIVRAREAGLGVSESIRSSDLGTF